MRVIEPNDEAQTRDAVAEAVIERTPLEICGSGGRRGFGAPVEAGAELSLRRLSGVIFYEPAELVLSARPGEPLRAIQDLLESQDQELAFEPPNHARFYGAEARCADTLGGAVAVNASGPRRIKAGAARDHLLGFRCVTGRGDIVKSGGRVMKNVTGYDLCKLVAGSHGTLAALTEITIKTAPRARVERTLLFGAADEATGLAVLRAATGLPLDVSGFAYLPADGERGAASGRGALRLEGSALSVASRWDALSAFVRTRATAQDVLSDQESRAFWAAVRDADRMREASGEIWRASVAPSAGFDVVTAIRGAGAPVARHFYDWAGGLVWLALDEEGAASAPAIRAAVQRFGGHATLMRASEATRARTPVFHPQPPGLAALTTRVKDSFDPLRLLNRGRMRRDL